MSLLFQLPVSNLIDPEFRLGKESSRSYELEFIVSVASELLVPCLDLVNNRVGVMS